MTLIGRAEVGLGQGFALADLIGYFFWPAIAAVLVLLELACHKVRETGRISPHF